MVLVLPNEKHCLEKLVSQMKPQHLSNMLGTRGTKQVSLALPRFKLSTQMSLVPTLMKVRNYLSLKKTWSSFLRTALPGVPHSIALHPTRWQYWLLNIITYVFLNVLRVSKYFTNVNVDNKWWMVTVHSKMLNDNIKSHQWRLVFTLFRTSALPSWKIPHC